MLKFMGLQDYTIIKPKPRIRPIIGDKVSKFNRKQVFKLKKRQKKHIKILYNIFLFSAISYL